MSKVIGYDNIEDILLNITDPNTGGAVSTVPGVSSPKINGATSVYNVEGGSGLAGWSTNVTWSSSDYNTVVRSSGYIYMPDGTNLLVSSGSTGNMSAITYIYYDQSDSSMHYTTSGATAVGDGKILLCVAGPTSSGKDAEFQAFGTNAQSTFITADNIAANTITGNEIQANSISAGELDVSYLSAISANLGTITAGDITGTTVTAGDTDDDAIVLNPSNNRLEVYYNGSRVGYIYGAYVSSLGGVVSITGDYIYVPEILFCGGKLRIPVGTNLYE